MLGSMAHQPRSLPVPQPHVLVQLGQCTDGILLHRQRSNQAMWPFVGTFYEMKHHCTVVMILVCHMLPVPLILIWPMVASVGIFTICT